MEKPDKNWAGNVIITNVFFLSPFTVKLASPAQVTKLYIKYIYIYLYICSSLESFRMLKYCHGIASSAIICHKEPMVIYFIACSLILTEKGSLATMHGKDIF